MDLYIQFRHTRPENSTADIGEVTLVYETSEIVEPPSPTSHLALVKITGLPASQSKAKLYELLASEIQGEEDVDGYDARRCAVFDFASLPSPFLNDFNVNKEVDIPFGIAVSLLHNRKLNRGITQGDFD